MVTLCTLANKRSVGRLYANSLLLIKSHPAGFSIHWWFLSELSLIMVFTKWWSPSPNSTTPHLSFVILSAPLFTYLVIIRTHGILFYSVGYDSLLFLFIYFEFLNFIYFLYSRFLLVIHFILLVYICQSQSPNSSHHHLPSLPSLFSPSVSLLLPCKPVHLYHFSRLHLYALIYVFVFLTYFTLYDSL